MFKVYAIRNKETKQYWTKTGGRKDGEIGFPRLWTNYKIANNYLWCWNYNNGELIDYRPTHEVVTFELMEVSQ